MEAADGAAGDGDEQAGEYRLAFHAYGRTAVLQPVPELRDGWPFDQQPAQKTDSHEYQRECEYRIDLAYDLVDREQGGYKIICDYDGHPDHHRRGRAAACHAGDIAKYDGRAVNEHCPDQYQQEDYEAEHQLLDSVPQVFSAKLRKVHTSLAEGHHAGEIVMHGPGENAAQYDPKECGGTELGSHDGSEDGACPRDVQELDHVDLPCRHGDEVHPVGLGDGGRRARRIGAEYPFDELSVQEVAQYQGAEADKERNHG